MSEKVKQYARSIGASEHDLETLEVLARGVWLMSIGSDVMLFVNRGYRLEARTIAGAAQDAYRLPPDPGRGDDLDAVAELIGAGNKSAGARRALAFVEAMVNAGALEIDE